MATPADPLQGHRLDKPAIDRLLEEVGVGVLSMVNDGVPYGLPLSFGYDGHDSLYFVFAGHSQDGRKVTYAEEARRVSFLVYDIESKDSWRSAILAGGFRRIDPDEWDAARGAIIDNAFRPKLLTETDIREDPRVWVLEADEKSGRAVGGT